MTACTSNLGTAPTKLTKPGDLDNRLAGTWVSDRSTQTGPGRMRMELHCDGTYETKVKAFLGLMRIREQGEAWASEDVLHLSRANGETTRWSYRFDNGRLMLEETAGEWHRYVRKANAECSIAKEEHE